MSNNRDHVRRLSRRMQYATAIVAAVVLAGTLAATVWAFADPGWFSVFLSNHYGNRNLPVSTTSAALLLLLFCIQIGVFFSMLWTHFAAPSAPLPTTKPSMHNRDCSCVVRALHLPQAQVSWSC